MKSDEPASVPEKPSEPSSGGSAPSRPMDDRPKIPDELPILTTRGVAVFPGIVGSLSVGRPQSRKLLEESLPKSKIIGIVAQKNSDQDNPGADELFRVGVACTVLKLVRAPDDSGVVIVVSALERIAIKRI